MRLQYLQWFSSKFLLIDFSLKSFRVYGYTQSGNKYKPSPLRQSCVQNQLVDYYESCILIETTGP